MPSLIFTFFRQQPPSSPKHQHRLQQHSLYAPATATCDVDADHHTSRVTSHYTDRFVPPPPHPKPDLTYETCPRMKAHCDIEHAPAGVPAYCLTLGKAGTRLCDVTEANEKGACLSRQHSRGNGIEAL